MPRSLGLGVPIDARFMALTVTAIGSFMSLLDSTVVNVALPDLLHDFHADLDTGQLVLTVYLLALAIVIPLSGFLGERVGMKRLYLVTLVLFTLGSILCGLAWNLPSLIVFRALQGLGGGMIQPLGMAIVFTQITPLERGRYMGLLGLPVLVAPILGPTLGGFLVEYTTWRMIFLINLPIGIINIVLAMRLLKETPTREGLRLDRPGLLFAVIGLPLVLLGLSQGEARGWSSTLVLTALGIGGAATVALVVTELRVAAPLLQIKLFRVRSFAIAICVLFVSQFALFGMQYLLPLFLQTARHLSPAQTGLVILPGGAVSFTTMIASGRAYNSVGPKPLVFSGLLMILASTLLLARVNEDTAPWLIAVLASGRGLGVGLCTIPLQTACYNNVADADIPRATATIQTLFRLFGSFSTAILTTVLVLSLGWHGAPAGASITEGTAPVPFMVKAFNDAYLTISIVVIAGIGLALLLSDHAIIRARTGTPAEAAE